jgi:FMN phosphatase YigB (HAD superfamily)
VIRTVLFDFGNVVAFFDHRKALRRLAPYTDLTPEQLFTLYYDSNLEDQYERGHISTERFVAEALRLGRLSCSAEEFLAAYCDIFEGNPETAAVIPRLKPHYRLLLASNTNDAHSGHYRRQFADVLRHFDALVLSQEARARKPEPAFYAYCQELADCEPGECVFIDDIEANVIAAESFGWHGIVYHGTAADLEWRLTALGVELA